MIKGILIGAIGAVWVTGAVATAGACKREAEWLRTTFRERYPGDPEWLSTVAVVFGYGIAPVWPFAVVFCWVKGFWDEH